MTPSLALVIIVLCYLWSQERKRRRELEIQINAQYEMACKEMDNLECNVKKSLEITVMRIRDGRCQDASEELEYRYLHLGWGILRKPPGWFT